MLGACGCSSSNGKPGGQGGGGVGGSTAPSGGSGGSTPDAGGADVAATSDTATAADVAATSDTATAADVAATSDTATALDSDALDGGGGTGTVPQQCLTGLVNPFAAMAPDWANWSSSSCSSLAAAAGSLVLTQNEPCSAASPNAIAGLAPPNVLCGDFDVQVDFAVTGLVAGVTGGIFASMRANDPTVTTNGMTIERYAAEYVVPSSQSYQNYKSYTTNKGDDATSVFVPTTDVTGRFRLTRAGTTVKSYYWKTGAPAGQWVLVNTATLTNTPWVLVLYEGDNSPANKGPTAPYSITFSNLLVTFPGATDAGTTDALSTSPLDANGAPDAPIGQDAPAVHDVAGDQARDVSLDAAQADTAEAGVPLAECDATAQASMGFANGYNRCAIVTIHHDKVPNSDQSDFPFLFSGVYPELATIGNGGKVTNAKGYDIALTSDATGQNRLDHEIDTYDPLTGTVSLWVRIPSLSHSTDTALFIWYGNSNVLTSQENVKGVWKNNSLSVYHFGTPSNPSLKDSASAGYDLSIRGNAQTGGAIGAGQGVVGGGWAFSNPNQSSVAGMLEENTLYRESVSAYPRGTSAVTLEAWFMTSGKNGNSGELVGYGEDGVNGDRVGLVIAAADFTQTVQGALSLEFRNIGVGIMTFSNDNKWHHLVGVYGGGSSGQVYLDGANIASTTSLPPISIPTTELRLGGLPGTECCWGFNGSLDEVRISSGPRSADWVATEYNNQSSPSTFYTMTSL
jgi:hypothetical protein